MYTFYTLFIYNLLDDFFLEIFYIVEYMRLICYVRFNNSIH